MIADRIKEHAENYSELFHIPLQLIFAIIMTESSGNVWAWRTEAHYRYLWDLRKKAPFRTLDKHERNNEIAPKDFGYIRGLSSRNTEWIGQQASWGCMQVMGAVAREYGFTEAFPQLSDPGQGIYYGCKHLDTLRNVWFEKYGWAGVAAAYNAGSVRFGKDCELVNQHYVDTVAGHGAADLFKRMEATA